MSMAMLIYLAEMSPAIRTGAMSICCVSAVLSAFCFMELKMKVLGGILATICVLSFPVCVLYPSGDAIYKIAGVTEQQKVKIDASGSLVKEKAK